MEQIVRKIPIGLSDFKRLIEDNYYYIDKSIFVKEIIDDSSTAILIPRPRRFGKTLNMSMLKYFFEKTDKNNSYLFENLNIWKYEEYRKQQGQYPLIYITFKDIKDLKFEKCFEKIIELISKEYDKYRYIAKGDVLSEVEIEYYNRILHGTAKQSEYETSLKNLCEFLSKYYEKRVIILIDEYDVPIQSGYLNGYYDEVIDFIRNFLSAGLKDNIYIEKAVLTGILRVAKESLFSGLNNLSVCTLLKNKYSESFGFLEDEVEQILNNYKIDYKMDEFKNWYNGYVFGDTVIYNPWSILNYVDNYREGFIPYWLNTSSNDLVKNLITKGTGELKEDVEELIKGNSIVKQINEDIVMGDIEKDTESVWSFLLFSGYLKVLKKERKMGKLFCDLKIPNLEVQYLYEEIILGWFKNTINNDKFPLMLKSLVSGDIKLFSRIFQEFVLNSVSYFDISGDASEKVYHAFVLRMLVALSENYEVRSNRESGYRRYDVMVIPKDKSKLGIVIEFKKVDRYDDEDLEKAAEAAINQIKEKDYKRELLALGVENLMELGIAFEGKKVLVKESKEKR